MSTDQVVLILEAVWLELSPELRRFRPGVRQSLQEIFHDEISSKLARLAKKSLRSHSWLIIG